MAQLPANCLQKSRPGPARIARACPLCVQLTEQLGPANLVGSEFLRR